ncbi:MAG: glycosyltransferase [Alphaproteobacteria bacterium]|jgi:GT2 family glycosyltransferase/glycosyltransferase involved in cell wall biosynthesis|nr:glycosyltransferase [Alphaproteobacteria bacterium]
MEAVIPDQTATATPRTAAPAACPDDGAPPVDIIIPFYRRADLVAPLMEALSRMSAEIAACRGRVIVINDSPDDPALSAALEDVEHRATGVPALSVRTNDRNLGFVGSVNHGLAAARDAGHDALLLNSDTRPSPGAFAEMRRVAYADAMTGFVSPRSNNATLCTLPPQAEYHQQSPAAAEAAFRRLARHLPPVRYVPTAVGFCLYIKQAVLAEFGLFSTDYGRGYNEENEYICRANRCGYRAVLANHAFVWHEGEASFAATGGKAMLETGNAARLDAACPEYRPSVEAYFASPEVEAEALLTALLPDSDGRLDLAFDFSSVGPSHNGTYEAAKALLSVFAARYQADYNIFVLATAEAARFHGLDRLERVYVLPPDCNRRFAVALRIGQPFEPQVVVRMGRWAVFTIWFMLDTIAWDCQYLALGHGDLTGLWRTVFDHADAVLFNSRFTEAQFAARFDLPAGLIRLASPHSYRLADYRPDPAATGIAPAVPVGRHVLVIGNHFQHKYLKPTVDALSRAMPDRTLYALGLDAHPARRVVCQRAGELSEATMDRLFAEAALVVFPSHYEGFGFPTLKALAYGKPVMVRDMPLAREIRDRLGEPVAANVHLYRTTAALATRLAAGLPAWQGGPPDGVGEGDGWERAADELADVVTRVLARPEPALPRLVRRLLAVRALAGTGGAESAQLSGPVLSPLGLAAGRRAEQLQAWAQRRPRLMRLVRPLWRPLWRRLSGL